MSTDDQDPTPFHVRVVISLCWVGLVVGIRVPWAPQLTSNFDPVGETLMTKLHQVFKELSIFRACIATVYTNNIETTNSCSLRN